MAIVAALAVAIYALSASPAGAQSTANIDFYVAATPVGDGSFTYSYPVINADGSIGGAAVVIPGAKFGGNGIAPIDDSIEGAQDFRDALDVAVAGTNATYSPCKLQFRIRNVYFIRADQAQLGPFFNAEDNVLDLGIKNGRSGLLAAFDQATAPTTGAFEVLVADLAEAAGESGRAADGGTTSVIQGGSLMDPRNNGFHLSHELGHNLNLPHGGRDPFTDIMSENEPDRGPGRDVNRRVETRLTGPECRQVDDQLKSGRLNSVLVSPDRRTSQVPLDGQAPQFAVWSNVGSMDRGEVSFLRTEFGGNVVIPHFGAVDRDDTFVSFGASGQVPIPGSAIDGLTAFASASFGWSEASARMDFLSAGGDELGILGVETNGFVTGAGLGDVTDLAYDDRYEEFLLRAGASADLPTGGTVEVRPHAALIYGRTDEDSSFSGVTNGATFSFDYDGHLESNRFGAEFGFDARVPLGTGGFSLYAGGALRLIYNDADGRVGFTTSFPSSEQRDLSESQVDLGGTANAGLLYRNGPLAARAGLDFETWQVPALDVTGTNPARIDYQSRSSVAGRLEVGIAF